MKTLNVAGVPEHFNYPWQLAIRANAADKRLPAINWTDFPGGTGAMVEALNTGQTDLALLLTAGALAGAQRGGNFRLVQVFVRSPLTWGIHVAAKSSLRSMNDKKALRVAISRYGSGSHLIAIVDALQRGADPANLEFVVVGSLTGARQALAAGKADIFLWERYTTSPLVEAGEFRRIDNCVVPWPAFVAALRKDLIAPHGAIVDRVLESVHGQARRLQRRVSAVEEIASTYQLDTSQTQKWFKDVRWSAASRCPRRALSRCQTALQKAGVIGDSAAEPASFWQPLGSGDQ